MRNLRVDRQRMPRRRDVFRLAALLSAAIQPLLCSNQFPDYPVRETPSYNIRSTNGEFVLAVEPVVDVGQQKTYFDFEFAKQGLVPVQVILQNNSTGSSLLLRREDIQFGTATSVAAGKVVGQNAGNAKMTGAAVVALPLAIVAFGGMRKASEARQNLIKRELRSQTIAPGQRAIGFLYVPVPKAHGPQENIALRVKALRLDPEGAVEFEVTFPTNSKD